MLRIIYPKAAASHFRKNFDDRTIKVQDNRMSILALIFYILLRPAPDPVLILQNLKFPELTSLFQNLF